MKAATLERIVAAQQRREALLVVTRLADGAQCLIDGSGCRGELDLSAAQAATAAELLAAGRSAPLPAAGCFARAYVPAPRLLIVGAVHIAQALAPMAAAAGFEVIVIDPRGAFASPQRFPGVQLSDEWPDEALARTGLDAATALVALSHDPKLDDPALQLALPSAVFYIGALGSRRTHEKRVERLRATGLGELTGRIHSPIGLDLGGRSPAEIAVSILAEIIQVRYRPSRAATREAPFSPGGRRAGEEGAGGTAALVRGESSATPGGQSSRAATREAPFSPGGRRAGEEGAGGTAALVRGESSATPGSTGDPA